MNEMTALILGSTIGIFMMASVALHHWLLARASINEDSAEREIREKRDEFTSLQSGPF